MKKILSAFGIISILLNTFIPYISYAEYTDTENNAINMFTNFLKIIADEEYEVGIEYLDGCYKGITTENYGIKILEYTCTDTNINIPEEINGYTVKEIGEEVFKDKGIQNLTLPESLEIIGTGAFMNNNFTENFTLKLPENLKRIEKNGFSSSNIKHYKFNNKLEYIGELAFYNNYSDNREDFDGELIFPDSLKQIGTGAFELVPIKKINLGKGVEEIGRYAFQDSYFNRRHSSDIEELVLPKSLKYIGGECFQNVIINKLTIENGIEEIGRYAFQGSSSKRPSEFTDLYIPESVKLIGTGAFQSNRLLNNVEIGSGNGTIEIKQNALDSCGINNLKINKNKIILEGSSLGGNPYEKILLSGDLEYRGNGYAFYRTNNNGLYTKNGNTSLTLNLTGKLLDTIRDYNKIKEINLGPNLTELSTIIFRNFEGDTIKIPGNIKTIHDKTNGHYNMYQKEIILEEGIKEIGKYSFNYSYNINSLDIPGSVEKIGEEAFRSSRKLKNLSLKEGLKEIGTGSFRQTDIESISIPDSVKLIGKDAFERTTTGDGNGGYINQKTIVYVINDIIPEISDPEKVEYIRLYKIDFTGDFNEDIYPNRKILNINEKLNKPEDINKNGYEFLGWYDKNSELKFDFENTPITENKILYAKRKPLEKKVEEEKNKNIIYTNETTLSIDNEIENEKINNSSLFNIISKEIEKNEIKEEDDKTTVQESEIQVTSDKTVKYQGGLEVYLEKTTNIGEEETKERIEGTAKFSSPVAVKIPITSKAETVKVQVKHEGEDFGYTGLTLNPYNECINGEAVNDKYNGENIGVIEISGEKYALIYTCSASTFVAYTENSKPTVVTESTPTPAAGGGRVISTTSKEQTTNESEHSSADIENKPVEQNTTTQAKEKVIDSKILQKSLTRGEIAIMTNILLDVFPQLVEGKQELDNITNACSNYADEQKFTKDEKKAITRLCKLSIMGIHADNNKPLDEFMINEWTKNYEFSKVINRSISNYNEKDFSVVKEALKKLEDNEENIKFGTVYNVFMSIKKLFN